MERWIDLAFLFYFGTHIPIALFFDSQAVFPKWLYPTPFVQAVDWYTKTFGDTMMAERPAWFQSFCACEMLLQFPFFFLAVYAYWKGISKHRWIRIPIIIYSSHVVTSLVSIFFHIFLHDFSQGAFRGPSTLQERTVLACFYFPYFIFPLMLLFDACFSSVYINGNSSKKRL
ncbi:sigma intracellular receptor 2-like [Dreissena polymorpha]|uniref:Sigma intracellular receptor 2 n=1 Tax=Dreissena polymorpha TaxID=45954 RepID=A0A9D4MVX9_DREPO|nr:sigma intracellular receptor 2-like [Dreissena polymorpha]KAH3883521.1 hypothetical protein DPMN_007480 [Dreissena polymorpha]